MELDEFKKTYRLQRVTPVEVLATPNIEGILRSKAQSILDQVVRNLHMEILLCIIFSACMATLLFAASTWQVIIFAACMLVYVGIFISYLTRIRKKIRTLHKIPSVAENLRLSITSISAFKTAYFQGTLVMIPVLLVTGFFYGLSGGRDVMTTLRLFAGSNNVWMFLTISAAWYTMMYFITRWYTRKLYGRHLLSLRQQLHDLED